MLTVKMQEITSYYQDLIWLFRLFMLLGFFNKKVDKEHFERFYF